jgi:phage gp46-like protein
MKKAMGWFAVLVLLAAPAAAQIKTSRLFIIERDKNTNVVHYDARLTADGQLDPKEPVIAY